MDDLNRAIQLESNDYIAFKNRGCVKAILEDFDGAISDFNYSLTLGPDLGEKEAIQDMIEDVMTSKQEKGEKRVRS